MFDVHMTGVSDRRIRCIVFVGRASGGSVDRLSSTPRA